ncbi:unnamed protein product [Rotaria socialis]|uniref:Uncharacterized protein n=1 Tax=Rotaria socialis TaxID=392032 RepID=A0A821HMT0_9BILA|nr:unnamed protein product [Rotaria socialis]
MLNRALRTLEIGTLLNMGFFIRHLHRRIELLHHEQSVNNQAPFTVYRGQGLSVNDFKQLQKSIGEGYSEMMNQLTMYSNVYVEVIGGKRCLIESTAM